MPICPAPDTVPCLDAAGQQDQMLSVGISGAGLVEIGLPDGSSVLLTWQAAERFRAHLASAVSAILRGEGT
jgi:hypothetical protein